MKWALTLAMLAALGVACGLQFISLQDGAPYSVPLSWAMFGLWGVLLAVLLAWGPLPPSRPIFREIDSRPALNDAEFGELFAGSDPTRIDTAIRVRDCLVEVVGDNLRGLRPDDSVPALIRDRAMHWDVSDWLSLRLQEAFHIRVKQDDVLAPGLTVRGLVELVSQRRAAVARV